jgi:hypothetical protein
MSLTRLAPHLALLALLAGCAAAAGEPPPIEDERLSNALAPASGPTVVRVDTEDELVEQLTILLEHTASREPELRAAYEAYLAERGEAPVVLVGGADAEVCAAAVATAAAGATLGELAVDTCRTVALRFAWSPWGWVSAIVCTAIDRAEIDRAIGRAIGRALGGLAACRSYPEAHVGPDRAPVLAAEAASAAETAEEPAEERVDRSQPHAAVPECTEAQIDDLCARGADGRLRVNARYHGADACGAVGDPAQLFGHADCDAAIGALFGDPQAMSDAEYCAGAENLAERAARCQRGREIASHGCFGGPDARHQRQIEAVRNLRESCRTVLLYDCPAPDPYEPRFTPLGQTFSYCAPIAS